MAQNSRRWTTDGVSTTKLLRKAHENSQGDIARAIALLRAWSYDHWNARGAIRVLKDHTAKGHTVYTMDGPLVRSL